VSLEVYANYFFQQHSQDVAAGGPFIFGNVGPNTGNITASAITPVGTAFNTNLSGIYKIEYGFLPSGDPPGGGPVGVVIGNPGSTISNSIAGNPNSPPINATASYVSISFITQWNSGDLLRVINLSTTNALYYSYFYLCLYKLSIT